MGTASEQASEDNREALGRLVERAALGQACRVLAEGDLDDYGEAVLRRDVLVARLESEAALAADVETVPDIYRALLDLRGQVVQDVDERAADAARMLAIVPTAPTSTIELAWRYHGDADRAIEIETRNQPQAPGFLPAGTAVRVLGE